MGSGQDHRRATRTETRVRTLMRDEKLIREEPLGETGGKEPVPVLTVLLGHVAVEDPIVAEDESVRIAER